MHKSVNSVTQPQTPSKSLNRGSYFTIIDSKVHKKQTALKTKQNIDCQCLFGYLVMN